MPRSLRHLLARHATLLVVDTCATRAEAALWIAGNDAPAVLATVEGEASAALPAALAQLFAQPGAAGRAPRTLDAVAFCDGPGSVLGVRMAAATLRTWRAVNPSLALYSYHSLSLLASAWPELTVIADARRDSWHAARGNSPDELLRVATAELAALGPLGTPDNFRRWSALPAGIEPRPLAWSAAARIAAASDGEFFHEAPSPDAFLHEQPSYVAWTPKVHQAPVARAATPTR